MESSSENSFAWTETSSDSCGDSFESKTLSSAPANLKIEDNIHFSNSNMKIQEHKYCEITPSHVDTELKNSIKKEQSLNQIKEYNHSKKKSIKQEPESDNDLSIKKKKLKDTLLNGNKNGSQDPMSYDESYLNMKVKEEESNTISSTKQKQKKRKHQSSNDTSDELTNKQIHTSDRTLNYENNIILKQEQECELVSSKHKKKNKKAKKDKTVMENADLKVDKNIKALAKESISGPTESSIIESNIYHEDSEESSCNEISAIKCDDDNHHIISFTNKSIDKEKINGCNLNEKYTNNLEQDSNETFKQRISRISDRLCFEDEDDTNLQPSPILESKHSTRLKQFTQANPNLKQLSQNQHNNLSLSQDEEIWIMKSPNDIDINDFTKARLTINGKCKIKIGGNTYDSSVENEWSDKIALLTLKYGRYQIQNLPLNGIIQLRKRIPKAHYRDDNIMENNQTNFIPLPETKCRHPLFGSNYKKALKIPSAIAERLNKQDSVKKKKKKDKKDKIIDYVDSPEKSDTIVKLEPQHSMVLVEKKKKKRKATDGDGVDIDAGPAPKKLKRKRSEPTDVWESEKAIEKNLFNF